MGSRKIVRLRMRLHGTPRAASLGVRVRLWWNWQTRYFEVVVGKPVQVQVLLSAPKKSLSMIKLFLPAFLSILMLTGCARHYRITLTNNNVITTTSKPKVNKAGDAFIFKDRTGKMMALPKGSVKQIEPQSSSSSPDPIFKPK
jgi:hypothetical protein